jgi:hypothetical protein
VLSTRVESSPLKQTMLAMNRPSLDATYPLIVERRAQSDFVVRFEDSRQGGFHLLIHSSRNERFSHLRLLNA